MVLLVTPFPTCFETTRVKCSQVQKERLRDLSDPTAGDLSKIRRKQSGDTEFREAIGDLQIQRPGA